MSEALVLVVIIGILLILNQWIHFKERSDLLDRLMARDLPELATFQIERERARINEDTQAQKDHLVSLAAQPSPGLSTSRGNPRQTGILSPGLGRSSCIGHFKDV